MDDVPHEFERTRYPGIYRRRGRYKVRVKAPDGRWVWLAAGFTRLTDAVEARADANAQNERIAVGLDPANAASVKAHLHRPLGLFTVQSHGPKRVGEPAAGSLLAEFAAHMAGRRRRERTIRDNLLDLNTVFRAAGVATLAEAAAATGRYAAFLDTQLQRGASPRRRNQYRVVLHAFFAWAVATDRCPYNPVGKIPRLEQDSDRRRVDRDLTPDEFWRLVRTTEAHAKHNAVERSRFYLVAGRSGLRWATVARLTWSMVDLDGGAWHIPGAAMKAKKGLSVPIEPVLLAALRAWRAETGPHFTSASAELLFAGTPGRAAWLRDLVRAGIDYDTPAGRAERKCLRTTFAVELRAAGVAIEDIADLLGHSDIRVTRKRYAHPRLANQRGAVAKLPGEPQTKERTA